MNGLEFLLRVIRSSGWSVAVHNDYRLNGLSYTFWLFTKGPLAVKAEGRSDHEALTLVHEQVVQLSTDRPCGAPEPTGRFRAHQGGVDPRCCLASGHSDRHVAGYSCGQWIAWPTAAPTPTEPPPLHPPASLPSAPDSELPQGQLEDLRRTLTAQCAALEALHAENEKLKDETGVLKAHVKDLTDELVAIR